MTEHDWSRCHDPQQMLAFLRDSGRVSDRQLRLFACACCRRVLHLLKDKPSSRRTIEFAERYADGLATKNDLHGRAWGKAGRAGPVVLIGAWDAATTTAGYGAGLVANSVVVIGKQNGPGSASKTDPPGFRGSPVRAGHLSTARDPALVPQGPGCSRAAAG
jgi:hypothetical protein